MTESAELLKSLISEDRWNTVKWMFEDKEQKETA